MAGATVRSCSGIVTLVIWILFWGTHHQPSGRLRPGFAAEKRRLHLIIRTIGQARATAKNTLANLAYNFTRLAWLTRQAAAA
jgi:hypothetical protein